MIDVSTSCNIRNSSYAVYWTLESLRMHQGV